MIQLMADSVEQWCANVATKSNSRRVIVLSGPFGAGKSTVLRRARKYVNSIRMDVWPNPWPGPPQVYSCEWADFVREQTEEDNQEMKEDLLESHIIFIDDIGSEEDRFKSGAPARILGDILGKLHDTRRFVFITTNVALEGWSERWDGRVQDRLLRMDPLLVDLWRDTESFSVWKLKQGSAAAQSQNGAAQ